MHTYDRKRLGERSVDDWTWRDFLADHPELVVESVWFRSLFDDVRRGWEASQTSAADTEPTKAAA